LTDEQKKVYLAKADARAKYPLLLVGAVALVIEFWYMMITRWPYPTSFLIVGSICTTLVVLRLVDHIIVKFVAWGIREGFADD
jgi:uncharacterized protein (DUF983 family)